MRVFLVNFLRGKKMGVYGWGVDRKDLFSLWFILFSVFFSH